MQAAKKRFAECKECSEMDVEFEGNEITLDISRHGVLLAGGWTVLPYTHPGVRLLATNCIAG